MPYRDPEERAEYKRRWRESRLKAAASGLVEIPHGTPTGYINYGCRDRCCLRAIERSNTNYTHQTPPGSGSNNGEPWEPDHLEIAVARKEDGSYELTAREVAELLGRTIIAVNGQRKIHRERERLIREADELLGEVEL